MRVGLGSARAWRNVLGVLAVASFAAAVPLTLLSHQDFDAGVAAAIGVPCAVVGWLVTRRQPGNPIGWLFLVTGVFIFLSTSGGDYGTTSTGSGTTSPWARRDRPWPSSGAPAWSCSEPTSCCSPMASWLHAGGGRPCGSTPWPSRS